MFVARAYRIDPDSGAVSGLPSIVLFGHSARILRRKLERKPGVKKVTVETLKPQFEETVIAEGLVTRK